MTDESKVNEIARLLMAEWVYREGEPVPLSYIGTFADMARVMVIREQQQMEEIETIIASATTIQPSLTGWQGQLAEALIRAFRVGMDTCIKGIEEQVGNDIAGYFNHDPVETLLETLANIRQQFDIEKGWDK